MCGIAGIIGSGLTFTQAFIGQMQGSIGETSLAACLFGAVVLIFFYLLWVVFPLFMPASSHMGEARAMPGWAETEPVFLAVEEQREVGLRVTADGRATFFHIADGEIVLEERLPLNAGARIVAVADSVEHNGMVAVATNDGGVYVFQHEYPMTFSGGVETRKITPVLSFPYGEEALLELPFPAVYDLAYSDGDREIVIAAIGAGGRVKFTIATKAENFLTGEVMLEPDTRQTDVSFNPTAVAVSGNHRWLYLGDNSGRVHSFSLPTLEPRGDVHAGEGGITAMTMLLGGISVLAGDSAGHLNGQCLSFNGYRTALWHSPAELHIWYHWSARS